MAKDNEASKAAADKGKAKAVDPKAQDAPKDKDGKPVANGKKDDKDEKPESEFALKQKRCACDGWTLLIRCATQPRSSVKRTSS